MSGEDDIRHIPGIWFSKGGGSIIPVPPPAFFDDVPEDLEFGLTSVYPFTQSDVLRRLIEPYPEVLAYTQEYPMPGGSMKQCLEWASPIGMALFRNGYSLLYCNHLTTCHTDEVELKRAIAGLPEPILSHWPKNLQINVCLGNDPDVQPVIRTWSELTMSHLTSGQRFAFSLPPVTPRESVEPTVHLDAGEESEASVRSGAKSAIQRELDEIAAESRVKQKPPRRASTAAPLPRASPVPPPPLASSPSVSPSRMIIYPLRVALVLAGAALCGFLAVTHWWNSAEGTGKQAGAEAELHGGAARAGVSEHMLDSHAQGRSAGVATSDPTNQQSPRAPGSGQISTPAPTSFLLGPLPVQRSSPDNQQLLEAIISMCDVYGANAAHRTGLPSVEQDENGEWHILVPVKNIRDDQRQADSLGLMALVLAHTFSGQVNGAVVKCTMTGLAVSGLSEDLVTANSSDFQSESKSWLVHEDAFPAANQHGWAVYHLASDPTKDSKEVVPFSPETPVLRIFPVKQTSTGAFSVDGQTPLLTVYTLSDVRWTGNKPTITLNDKDIITYATITRKYSHDFLFFAANGDTGEMARIEGEVTDGEIAFTKPEDEAIAACLRTRFSADGVTPNSVDDDQGYRLYVNKAQRYSVTVSALLAPALHENASGDSVTATSDDGRVKLLLRVKRDVGSVESQYKQWTAEHTVKDPGKVVGYKTLHGNWFVVSGHDGSRGYYVKVIVRGPESLFLCLEYDEKQGNDLGKMLTKMSRSFTGDVDVSSGARVQASQPAAQSEQPGVTSTNTPPVPEAGSLSRREWRERLRKYCTIPSGHQLISNEKRLFAVMGKPDDVEHEGRNTYWYYKCTDGVVQLAFQLDPDMMGGQIIAEVSDER